MQSPVWQRVWFRGLAFVLGCAVVGTGIFQWFLALLAWLTTSPTNFAHLAVVVLNLSAPLLIATATVGFTSRPSQNWGLAYVVSLFWSAVAWWSWTWPSSRNIIH